ncbi:MAG: preprotein translocase subunit YajC [Muribaculaceae bacterium]|nr:preprotein translocase subunit YajC [Muribaculaceae bacterium]
MKLAFILAQDAAQQGGMSSLIMIVALIAIFYFFMIRPQQKKQKKIREERAALTKGDSVITAGGIYGKIKEVRDDCFIIEIDQNVKVRVDKNMVYRAASAADAVEANQQQGK